jgi:FKBP-type peptidyl-prolyl cis-trans isomerase SlyD
MEIADQKVVSIDYTLTDSSGKVIDSSNGREPLAYLHGAGNIIPGLEKALTGKSTGDAVTANIPPGEAYGEKDPQLVQAVPRDRFPAQNITVGMQFQAQGGGQSRVVTVVNLDPENVTIDANHPLAGETLNFDVKVVDVRDATAEELSHGHVHGAGGHQH